MATLIMPKQTAQLDRFYYSLNIFYDAYQVNDPLVPNSIYKEKMTEHFDDLREHNDGAKIVKQSEMTRYFGVAFRDYDRNTTQITDRGIKFYEAFKAGNSNLCIDLIVESILRDSFGRNNTAIKSSDSDIDPPKLFVKAIINLGGITRKDFSLLLYYTNDMQLSFEDACIELQNVRANNGNASVIIAEEKVNKYGDPKFTVFLDNIGICETIDHKYYLSSYVKSKYSEEFKSLEIYNRKPDKIFSSAPVVYQDNSTEKDTDCSSKYKESVSQTVPYDIESPSFENQNNRKPDATAADKLSHRFPTVPRIAKTALALADFQCEFDSTHITFMGKNDTQFMEAHHLVPMTAQSDFDVNLDRVENIVSLCPNCHSAIHYGAESERKRILTKLYNKRKEDLENSNIDINFNTLFSTYYN